MDGGVDGWMESGQCSEGSVRSAGDASSGMELPGKPIPRLSGGNVHILWRYGRGKKKLGLRDEL